MTEQQALFKYCVRLGDNALIQSYRLAEWCSNAPMLEEDLALTNMALDMTGRAQMLLQYAGSISGGTFKGKDMYSLYVEPGFLVNGSTLVYAKAAYLSMKGEASDVGVTGSENFDGLGYGAGVRVAFGKTFFWQFELTQSDYNAKSIYGLGFKPAVFNRTFGVGYRF